MKIEMRLKIKMWLMALRVKLILLISGSSSVMIGFKIPGPLRIGRYHKAFIANCEIYERIGDGTTR
jgi:hypothetical protein